MQGRDSERGGNTKSSVPELSAPRLCRLQGLFGRSSAQQGWVWVMPRLKDLQKSFPANNSHYGLVTLSTEAMEALRKDDGFLSYIKASFLLLRIIEKYYF